MGVEANSNADTGESVLKLGGNNAIAAAAALTQRPLDVVKKSLRQVDM